MRRGDEAGVLAHLQTLGELNDEGVALVYRLVGEVVRGHGFPPPTGKTRWDDDAVEEAAHNFIADHLLGKRRLDSLMLRAREEEGFQKLLRTSVLNYFRDLGRATNRGALIRRLGSLLQEDDQFRLWQEGSTLFGRDSLWGLSDWGNPIAFGDAPSSLVSVAWTIPGIRIVRWRETSTRRSPASDRDSLIAFLIGLFEAAAGTMCVPDIAEVAAHRFSLLETPAFVALDDPDEHFEVKDQDATPEEQVGARDIAAFVLGQLSERERGIFLKMGAGSTRSVADELGLPKSTVFDAAQRIRDIVETATDDGQDIGAVLRELERMLGGSS